MLNTKIAPWPFYDTDEIEATTKVLTSGKVNQWTGSEIREFEKEFAAYVGTEHAVAVSNGTIALDLILREVLLDESDPYRHEVIVTSRTFMASVSSIIMAGLTPVFADVDPESGNITPESIRAKITNDTCAILCVHLAGWPCEMDPIMEIAKQHNLFVIEDCAQAHGAVYKGQKVGSFGHASAWSFCQDKIMSTGGEGGMITTNDPDLWRNIWEYKDHGKNYDLMFNTQHPPGFRWVHDSLGSNYRMTEIQAAIGRVQLRKLDDWIVRRNSLSDFFDGVASQYPALRVAKAPSYIRHAKYKHYVYVNPEGLKKGWSRDRIILELNYRDVPCMQGSCSEVYLEKALNYLPGDCPEARKLGETSLMFLVHPNITHLEALHMSIAIDDVFSMASK